MGPAAGGSSASVMWPSGESADSRVGAGGGSRRPPGQALGALVAGVELDGTVARRPTRRPPERSMVAAALASRWGGAAKMALPVTRNALCPGGEVGQVAKGRKLAGVAKAQGRTAGCREQAAASRGVDVADEAGLAGQHAHVSFKKRSRKMPASARRAREHAAVARMAGARPGGAGRHVDRVDSSRVHIQNVRVLASGCRGASCRSWSACSLQRLFMPRWRAPGHDAALHGGSERDFVPVAQVRVGVEVEADEAGDVGPAEVGDVGDAIRRRRNGAGWRVLVQRCVGFAREAAVAFDGDGVFVGGEFRSGRVGRSAGRRWRGR